MSRWTRGPAARALHRAALAVLLAACGGAERAAARPLLAGPFLSLPIGNAPSGVAQADFDGDGHLDLVTSDFGANTLTLAYGGGDGRFTRTVKVATADGPSSVLAVSGGATGFDLVVTNYRAGGISYFRNDGSGNFTRRVDLEGEPGAVQAAWGDVTADGRPDVVVANYLAGQVTVYDSRTGFASRTNHSAGPGPIGVAVGDLDGDGLNDAVVTNYSAGTLSLLPADPAGLFRPRVPYEVMAQPLAALGADLDGDGRMDVAVPGSANGTLLVLHSTRGFEFDRRDTYPAGARPAAVVAADFDGDHRLDLAVAQSDGRAITLLKGTGGGGFTRLDDALTGPGPVALVAEDFNEDGRLDLAAASNRADELALLLGNGDGRFGSRSYFPTTGSPRLVAGADMDGDGRADLVDATDDPATLEFRRAAGASTFEAPRALPLTRRPVALALGPLAPGGPPRVVVAGAGGDDALTLFGWAPGTGDPLELAVLPLGTRDEISAVALSELNGDGVADLAATLAASGRIAIWLGAPDGSGSFSGPRLVEVGPGASGVAAADFDRDGYGDLAVTARGSSRVTLLAGGPGDPPLTPHAFEAGLGLSAPAVDDFNRDGWPDLAAVDADLARLLVCLGDGAGGLLPPVPYACGRGTAGLVLADLNADNRRDFITVNPGAGTVTTWYVRADGTLRERQDFGAGAGPVALTPGEGGAGARSALLVADAAERRLVLLENGVPLTPVALLDFRAEEEPGGTVVRWRVPEEARRQSFRLFRSLPGGPEEALTADWLTGREEYAVRDEQAALEMSRLYRLAARDIDGEVRWFGPLRVEARPGATPRLAAPTPNPSRGDATLAFTLPRAGRLRLVVCDVAGRLMRTLLDEDRPAGSQLVTWDGRTDAGGRAPAGLYLVRLEAAGLVLERKVIRLR